MRASTRWWSGASPSMAARPPSGQVCVFSLSYMMTFFLLLLFPVCLSEASWELKWSCHNFTSSSLHSICITFFLAHTFTPFCISLSGLARWFYVNRLAHENVRWLIQIPRLYSIYKQSGEVESFGQMLRNIFEPLFAVSIDPSSNPPLHYFLQTVVGECIRPLISPI